ncbi:hypothetical protein PABG_12409 [Paracoccidioides brasiliensis Pb03]|nr:hypothetical protein PABG_12409 [Paracoccidioides brasiliensis Pb03]
MSQQVYNVKAVPAPPPGDFDLHRAKEEGFSPDTLKSAIERFYATVVIGLINAFKHFDRLRSSKRLGEQQRSVYFAAWVLDLIIPTALSTLLLLIFSPSSRILLFPPVPISLVSCETGGAQQPKAGVVGSKGTVTGAPEKFKGEAVEQEASNLVSGASRLALECAGGKYDDEAQADDKKETSSLGDPANIVSKIADAATASRGGIPSEEHDKTKEPMMEIIREKGNTDNGTFLAGLGFFGDPIISKATELLDRKPRNPTQAKGEGGNLIFRGVPTNAQLTLTIFRIGEACGYPVPAPPVSLKSKTSESVSIAEEELPQEFLDADINPQPPEDSSETGEESPAKAEREKKSWEEPPRPELKQSLLMITPKAALGSMASKQYLGILRKKRQSSQSTSPTTFRARYKGQKGGIIIASRPSTEPLMLYFTTEPGQQSKDISIEEGKKKGTILFSISINEIQVLKKISVMGWSEPNKEVVDGLVIFGEERGATVSSHSDRAKRLSV